MPGATGERRMWEEEMLAEYLARFHRGDRVFHRVRLGPRSSAVKDQSLSEAELRAIGAAWRRWADALIVHSGTLLVVEAALVPDPGDVSRLLTYLLLLPLTPEIAEFHALPMRGLLVWGVDDPFSRQVAVRSGIEVRIFRPSHWLEYVTALRAREAGKSSAPRTPAALVSPP